jgi:ABC-type Zn uptake system ZnuABC Zn-binding protein ZnuA
VPALLDRAGNPRIREGARGHVAAYRGVRLLEVPASTSREHGDIHVAGNPHIFTDPVNAIVIARNVLAGLARVAPADTAYFGARARDFEQRILVALYGAELVRILTPATLLDLARTGRDWEFINRTRLEGRPLAARLGGWLAQARDIRGRDMVCYHKEWAYFTQRFGARCVEYVEPKPGIPPTPRHVQEVIALMRERRIRVLFSANYYDAQQLREIAQRTGATAVVVAENVQGAPGTDDYFALLNSWIAALTRGFETEAHP